MSMKVATTPLVASGHAVGFRITVKNRGADTAQNVVLVDQARGRASAVVVHTAAGRCRTGRLVICRLGTIEHGATATITVRMRLDTPASQFTNRAVAGTSTEEASLPNNIASAPVTVTGPFGCASSAHAERSAAHIFC